MKLEDTINEIRQDLTPLDMSRNEFLALCARNRIESVSMKYNENFDRLINMIDSSNKINSGDISNLLEYIRVFSDTISNIYDRLSNELSAYNQYFN